MKVCLTASVIEDKLDTVVSEVIWCWMREVCMHHGGSNVLRQPWPLFQCYSFDWTQPPRDGLEATRP